MYISYFILLNEKNYFFDGRTYGGVHTHIHKMLSTLTSKYEKNLIKETKKKRKKK